jgi:[ribosomal protein S5]-alanine N-acetyltransferase
VRLTLRPLAIHDEQEIFTLRSDHEVNKYLNRKRAKTIEDARFFINMINENIHKNDSVYWAITLSDNDLLIGTICLFGFSEEGGKCEIGYELLTNFWGQGIMSEALKKVIDYAFNTIKVQKLEAIFHRDNLNSIKLLKKFSFKDSKNQADETNPDLICYRLDMKNPH